MVTPEKLLIIVKWDKGETTRCSMVELKGIPYVVSKRTDDI